MPFRRDVSAVASMIVAVVPFKSNGDVPIQAAEVVVTRGRSSQSRFLGFAPPMPLKSEPSLVFEPRYDGYHRLILDIHP